jgi:hypothetical protein
MKLTVKRFSDNGNATLGAFYINGKFEAFTLCDEHRDVKVMHETRIPEGTYEVKFRKEGSFHQKYTAKFGAEHYGMLHITNVPKFEYILIHIGNTEKDTSGCILVGDTAFSNHTLGSSTVAYQRLYKKVAMALLKGEKVEIEIKSVEH